MSFWSMTSELTGSIPKLPYSLAQTFINRGWREIRRMNLWSFQLFEANWVSPAIVNAGTVTTTTGSDEVVFDATASAAIAPLALLGPFPTNLMQRQFRVGIGTFYNIFAISNPSGIVTLTLDRPYAEASGTGQAYAINQSYYPAPMQDFLTFLNVRDIVNYNNLDLLTTRQEVDFRDPQRSIFYIPSVCCFYMQNQNPASSTYGVPLFELWGVPTYVLTYQLSGIRKGTPLVNDSDELPPAVGEDCVIAKAKYYAYQWAEGNKGDMPRNQGSDFKFLMGSAEAEFKGLVKQYRKDDRETVDNWYDIRRKRYGWLNTWDGYYSAIGQTASPGAPWLVILASGLATLHALHTCLAGAFARLLT